MGFNSSLFFFLVHFPSLSAKSSPIINLNVKNLHLSGAGPAPSQKSEGRGARTAPSLLPHPAVLKNILVDLGLVYVKLGYVIYEILQITRNNQYLSHNEGKYYFTG